MAPGIEKLASVGAAFLAAAFLLSGAARVPAKAPAADDAVAFQMNPAHSGNDDQDNGFSTPFSLAWTHKFNAESMSYPIIAQGLVIAKSDGDSTRLFALDLATGDTVWMTAAIRGGAWDPTYDNGSVFLMGYGSADLVSYDAETGEQQWSNHLTPVSLGAPTAGGGQVFVVDGDSAGTVYAVDESTGNVNWTQKIEGNASSDNPAYDGSSLYVDYGCSYYKLGAVLRNIDWHRGGGNTCRGTSGLPPAYYSGRVFMADGSGSDYILNSSTGRNYGSFAVGSNFSPAFFTYKGRNYGLTVINGILYCILVTTGDVVWSFTDEGGVITSPIVVNNLVAVSVGYPTNKIFVLSPATGKSIWSVSGTAQWLAAGDDVLIASGGGGISAYAPQ